VFSNGGYLYTFDLKSQKAKKLTVYLPGDRDLARPHWANVSRYVTDFDISPEGNRAVLTARGDIFTVPAKDGSIRNLTQTPGIREKYAAWSPDGKWIAYLSDRTGEEEIYITPQDGMGKETRITTDGKMFRMPPVWSPDSKKLLFADKDLRLFYVDIDQKTPVLIDQGKYFDITEYVWAPDSKWVAYAKMEENTNKTINLYSLADKKITPVTTSFTPQRLPAFDPGASTSSSFPSATTTRCWAFTISSFQIPKLIASTWSRCALTCLRRSRPRVMKPARNPMSPLVRMRASLADEG
jgi:tricorn protease